MLEELSWKNKGERERDKNLTQLSVVQSLLTIYSFLKIPEWRFQFQFLKHHIVC